MKNTTFNKDIYRYYGTNQEPLKRRLFRPKELQYLRFLRRCQENHGLLRLYYRFRLKHLSIHTHIQIPWNTQIGEGLYLGHLGRIIINEDAILGKNINIATGVTIGQTNRGRNKGCPIIGDNCWIGTNAVIVGKVNIGNDVLIAPLSYVNFDVPDHSVVLGNPGKIFPREHATAGYIENTV